VRRLLPGYRLSLVLLLLPLLLPVLGFAPGAQTSEDEVLRVARSVPEVEGILSHPTVEISARYDAPSDSWEVILREEVSGTVVAVLTVEDETQEVSTTEVYPIAETLTYPSTSEEEAIKLALADPEVGEELTRHGPYASYAEYEDGEWTVYFEVEEGGAVGGMTGEGDERKEIARVGVDDETWQINYVWTGDQVGWRMARGDYGAYGKHANYPYIWGPLALLFALAFWRTERLYSLRNLDILALLSFLISHGFFRVGETYPAVLLWYPPLLYLLARMLLMGFGIGERVEKTSNFPTAVLFALGVLASGLVLGLNLDSRVIDVGYAGVVGADRILDGALPYGNMPEEVGTGDTYGPLNYLLYVPFLWLSGWSGEWDFLPAAHAVTALAFLVGAIFMFVAGRRYAGAQGGAAMLFAWAVFPYTLYSANNNTNDIIVAAVAAVAVATATSPLARGASIVAGFAVKLFPIILAPLWMLHDGTRRRGPILDFVLGGVGVFLLTFWVLALDGDPISGMQIFYEKTLAFQSGRETPWTIFAQVPELKVLQQVLTAAVILLAFVVPVVLKKRTIRRLAALSAALVIAFELTVNYWFYPYVTWFEPFVFVALLLANNEKTALDRESDRQENAQPSAASDQRKAG
jgi:hypothetical protein